MGGVYTMQSMDTNTEYQKVVRVGDQMGKIVKITIRIIFLWNLNPLFFKKEIFKSHLKKSPPSKMPIPTQNPNLSLYKPSKKWLKAAAPSITPECPTMNQDWQAQGYTLSHSYKTA